jgi:hypothetical protein
MGHPTRGPVYVKSQNDTVDTVALSLNNTVNSRNIHLYSLLVSHINSNEMYMFISFDPLDYISPVMVCHASATKLHSLFDT